MSRSGKKQYLSKSCILLIVIAGMERFAFKGVSANLVTYLTDVMKMSNSSASKTVNNWFGFTSMLPLLVAPLADSCWDRYSTILLSSFLYILGLISLTSTTLKTRSPSLLLWSLYLISLGQGGFNPSLQAFGADQLEDMINNEGETLPSCNNSTTKVDKDKKSSIKSKFFQWWYVGVCSGILISVTFMSYIQDTFGWVLGFAIPTLDMVISVALFSCGSRIYVYKQLDDDDYNHVRNKPFEYMMEAIKATASKLMISRRITIQDHDQKAEAVKPVLELELEERALSEENFGEKDGGLDHNEINPEKGFSMLENVKVVVRLLPIWTMLLIFAVIFQQPATFFTKQGMAMKRNLGQSNFMVPPATLQGAITISIISLMPLYDKILVPITKLITQNQKGISVIQRMGVGMFLSVIAMVIAALVETKRLEMRHENDTIISIFWLLPQYILLGISDIFTVVGMQEFFYSQVPMRMRTMGFALYNSVFGVGSFLSAFLISMIEMYTSLKKSPSWFSDDMNEACLDKYYWLLALSSAFSLLVYVVLSRCYETSPSLEYCDDNCK